MLGRQVEPICAQAIHVSAIQAVGWKIAEHGGVRILLLALRHVTTAAVAWSAGALSFVVSFALLPGEPLFRASAALAVASLIAAVALGAALLARAR